MKSTIQRIARTSAALALTGMLGYGAAQAFASPGQPAGAARVCENEACKATCIERGYDSGFCKSGGICQCLIVE